MRRTNCYIISFCTDLEEQNSHLSSCLRFLFIVVGKVLNITVGKRPSNLHLRYVMLYTVVYQQNTVQPPFKKPPSI